jgi:hypothetical protein
LVGRGGTGVRVRVGRGVLVNVARGSRVRAVKVMRGTGVVVGVRVLVAVRVGVDVGDGISEAVCVGAVEVGKGPSSASEVSATAVRVLFARRSAAAGSGDSRVASA